MDKLSRGASATVRLLSFSRSGMHDASARSPCGDEQVRDAVDAGSCCGSDAWLELY